MNSIARDRNDAIVGVHTHKDQRVCLALNDLGGRPGEFFVPAATEGYSEALRW